MVEGDNVGLSDSTLGSEPVQPNVVKPKNMVAAALVTGHQSEIEQQPGLGSVFETIQ